MGRAERGGARAAKNKANRFPWLLLLLLLASLYLFWIFPIQRGQPPVKISFEPVPANSK